MPQTSSTPSPAYPSPLPDAGIAATEWALDLAYGSRKQDAWVTTVIDIHARSEWAGDSYRLRHDELEYRSDAGHYVAIGVFKPGADRRTDENVEAVAVLVFDDVGSLGDPGIKMDKDWLRDRLEPTFIVETSTGNFQHSYVFDEPVGPDDYHALIEALKLVPEAVGGIKDGTSLTRYVRLPSGKNPKAEKGGFKTRLVAGSGKKYSLEELSAAFGLQHKTTGAAGAGNAKSAPLPEALALPEAEALALLDEIEPLIRNNGIGREDWIGIVYGFFNASGQNDDVEDIIDRFTAKREDGPTDPVDDFEHVWETRRTATKAGLTTLIRWLEKQGTPEATAMVDRIRQVQAKTKFTAEAVDNSGDNPPGPGAALPVIVDWETSKKGRTRTIQPTIFPGLDRGLLSVVGGASGTLKSTWLMHAAVAIIAERPDIIGHKKIDFCGDVLVFANEDPEEIIDKRLDAIMARHGVTSLKHKLYVQSGQMFEKTGRNGTFNWKPEAWDKIEAVILQTKAAKRQLALVAVDTLASTAAGNDETNREMQEIAGLMDDLVKQTFCAGLFVHHWRKSGPSDKSETDPQQDELRGGGALGNTVRNVLFVSKPNKTDIEDANWTPDVARDFIKLWIEKRSYGPTTRDDPAWFEKEKVAVPVIDPRDGTLHIEDYLVLLPTSINKAKQREAVLIEAWRKIKAANAAGRELVQMGKANKSVRSVQGYLGLSDDKAEKLLADLLARGWVELVDGRGSDRRDAKHVVALEIEEDSNI